MGGMGLVRALRRIALAGSVIAIALEARAQTVSITGLPPYGTLGTLVGTVAGVDFSTHRVATYIYIEGSGWWTKPTLASPTVAIDGDGAFAVDVGTGGPSSLDGRAVLFCAGIVPAAVVPETASGAVRIPASFAPLAMECEQRYGRTLWFSGLRTSSRIGPRTSSSTPTADCTCASPITRGSGGRARSCCCTPTATAPISSRRAPCSTDSIPT